MLFKKLFRTMGLYRAQFISMIIMIALGVGIFVGFNMEWVSIKENTSKFFSDTGFADYRITSEKGFSSEEAEKIKDISDVKNASRYVAVNVDIKERSGDALSLTVTEDPKVSGVMLISGEKYDPNDANGVWLSDKYAKANNFKCGDNITFKYKNIEISGKIKGLIKSSEYLICVRDSSQLMPDYTTFGFAYISPVFYKNATGYDFYPQINAISDMGKKDFCDKVDNALGKTTLVLTKEEVGSYSLANGEADEGKTMGSVLPVLFLLIAVLTMVTTMHRLTAKEKTQIGTLKALGFKDCRILLHYTSYAFMIGIIGSVIGIALGYAVAYFIMNPNGMMGTYFDMKEWVLYLPWFCTVSVLIIIALLTFIGFLSVKKMLKGTAADALRPYSPKKMKPLKIEKTKAFHKLSFGTRWNLRDIMRHKSRTAMSLVGIVGCMILVVGSLGMRDTMSEFLDMYYDGALKYSSRIYLTENATEEQKNEISEKYNGDRSASVGVLLEDKTVSLDIYSLKNDLVRFPNSGSGYADIGNDGAYICMRLADKFNLKKGDSVVLSPYGTNEKYTLKIAGIIRSTSECVVISEEYANSKKIAYTPDSVYTKTEKSEIASDSAIKTVQSKQAIMDSFDTFLELMNSMILVLVAGALVLGIVVLYNLGVMSYTERYKEMATLKVVGFKDGKIGRLLIGQNIWLSIIGILVGMPLGLLTLDCLLKKLAPEYEMRMYVGPLTVISSILLTFGVSLLVSLMVAKKNKKIDMVEALKGAE